MGVLELIKEEFGPDHLKKLTEMDALVQMYEFHTLVEKAEEMVEGALGKMTWELVANLLGFNSFTERIQLRVAPGQMFS
jgi:hypothetical protein